jgi:hypothetical protein
LAADGKTLKKDVLKSSGIPPSYTGAVTTSVVMGSIANGANPIFEYYDNTYDGTGASLSAPIDVSTIRLVKATVILDVDPNRSPVPITATSQVSLRNLKDNL